MELNTTTIIFNVSHGSETISAQVALLYEDPHHVMEMIGSGDDFILGMYRKILSGELDYMYGPISRDNIEHYLNSAFKLRAKHKGLISYKVENPPLNPEAPEFAVGVEVED